MARGAAVVGATAHIAAGHQEKKDAEAAAQQQAAQQAAAPPAPMPEAAPAAAPVAAGGMTDDKMAQLEKLGQLKADGVLTEEEFAAQKALILGS